MPNLRPNFQQRWQHFQDHGEWIRNGVRKSGCWDNESNVKLKHKDLLKPCEYSILIHMKQIIQYWYVYIEYLPIYRYLIRWVWLLWWYLMLLKFLSTSRYLILKGEMKKTLMPLTSLQEQVHGKMDTAASHPRRLSVRLEPLPGKPGIFLDSKVFHGKKRQKVRLKEPSKNGRFVKMILLFHFLR